ncbi:MAG: S9 family peptidase [Bdellovibrionales bacterium]|nr:S9 family peptidase [Bdellovibrionales bacterium]
MNKITPIIMLMVLILSLGCEKETVEVQPLKNPLTIERLFDSPALSGSLPKSLKVSPNGKYISFLKGKKEDHNILDLWAYNTQTGKLNLLVDSQSLTGGKDLVSDEERARRERMRIRESGIVSYQWSKQGDQILVPINGDIYIYKLGSKDPVSRLTESKEYELDPSLSPLGHYVSFVRDHNVFTINLMTKKEKAITTKGTSEKPFGVAEFVAQEEMARYRGYWWSKDEKYLAVAQVDNSPVEDVERFEVYSDRLSVIKQKYPKAGKKNAIVRLMVSDLSTGQKKWVDIKQSDFYIPQVSWSYPEKKSLLNFSIQSRDQKKIDFMIFDPESKKLRKVFEETDKAWVNIRHDYIHFKKSHKLIWVSERTGLNRLHIFDMKTGQDQVVTMAPLNVVHLHRFDESLGNIYFTAVDEKALETHLYQININQDRNPVKLTRKDYSHSVVIPQSGGIFISYQSQQSIPPSVSAFDLTGREMFSIESNEVKEGHPLSPYKAEMANWEYGEVKNPEGIRLIYKVLKPINFDASKKYPVIQYVYGGPGVQLVNNSWSRQNLFQQFLAQQGYIVVVADNRGTPKRGRDFERSISNNFGQIEVQDQSFVLSHLLEKNSFMDKDNVGVFGHSYGGYMTLMLMAQKPELYSVGVSGAPVVDWSYYDTHYTERFIGTPQDNADVYKKANVLTYAEQIKGKVLIVHGMADDNVLYNHSLIFYQKMQELGLLFDIMAYPGAKHGIRRKKAWSVHYFKSISNYFNNNLQKASAL